MIIFYILVYILHSRLRLRILVMTFPVCNGPVTFLGLGERPCYIQKVSEPFASEVYFVQEFSQLLHPMEP
uniref:Putative secreted protein n=1 Tax=Xenopsylla cheopis TaxID=163159 RepID=A0A6M2DXA0_XENCH